MENINKLRNWRAVDGWWHTLSRGWNFLWLLQLKISLYLHSFKYRQSPIRLWLEHTHGYSQIKQSRLWQESRALDMGGAKCKIWGNVE